jgi:hypothetical protein
VIAQSALCVSQRPTRPTTIPNPVEEARPAPVGPQEATDQEADIDVEELVRELLRQGVRVALKDNQISCIGLAPELRSRVHAHARALIRLLAPNPQAVCDIRTRDNSFSPKTMTLVRHNRTGHNRHGQDAATHPLALVNLAAWREADWNLAECRWYRDKADASGPS